MHTRDAEVIPQKVNEQLPSLYPDPPFLTVQGDGDVMT